MILRKSIFFVSANLLTPLSRDEPKCSFLGGGGGNGGGDGGGEILATGAPEAIIEVESSHTGRFLKPVLSRSKRNRQKASA